MNDFFDRPIAFHRGFLKFGGVKVALMLSQAVYWAKRTKDKDGWFYKTAKHWEDETGLTFEEQMSVRKKLRAFSFWKEKKQGIPAKLYFNVDVEKLRLILDMGKTQNREWEKPRSIYKETKNNTKNKERDKESLESTPNPMENTNESERKAFSLVREEREPVKANERSSPPIPLAPSSQTELEQVLAEINKLFKKSYKPTKGRLDKFKVRRATYTVEELLQAIRNAHSDKFYRGDNERKWIFNPDYFFRNDEVVDNLLNMKPARKVGEGFFAV